MAEYIERGPLLRQMADIAGFEIMGRIPLRDKATGKEYR